MDGPAGDKTDARPTEARRKEDRASQAERDEQYHAVIETDPILEEVGEANKKVGHTSEPRRVIPSKPC